jgi:hypothetical protein
MASSSSQPTDELSLKRMVNTTDKDITLDNQQQHHTDDLDDENDDIPLDESLADYSLETQKQMIGERIYEIV